MDTQKTTTKIAWECVLSSEQKDGVIKAALLNGRDEMTNGRDNLILQALLNGDVGEAVRISVIDLANYKILTQNHNMRDVSGHGVKYKPASTETEESNITYKDDDLFGAPTEEDCWDGDITSPNYAC